MQKEYLTISELNDYIKDVINSGFPQPIWVCGEIQQYDRNKSKKHVFFELIEKDEKTNDIIARIGLVIFYNRKTFVEDVLKRSENAFELKDDIEVKFACKVDFYAPHGAVRLIVENIDPTYTLGKMAQERQKLISELKKEGVFEKNKLKILNEVPLKLGLITSDDSAAFNDFISEIKKSGFGFKIILRNTLMQGKNAEKDICNAFKDLEKIKDLDAVVITRGGGSISDLSCFDSRLIAEKIATYSLPVLSGIGHEINYTITDMAAHTYAKTPTAIAQLLIERVNTSLLTMTDILDNIVESANDKILWSKQSLKDKVINLHRCTNEYLKEHNENIISLKEKIKLKTGLYLNQKSGLIDQKRKDLKNTVLLRIENDKKKCKHYKKMIDIVDPKKIMGRGFSITRNKDGKAIRNLKDVKSKDIIQTELTDGYLESVVDKCNRR